MSSEEEIPVTPLLPRTCGSCYACCVYLGIEELGKYPAQSCRYLSGIQGPEKRCGIYPTRPFACKNYSCAWISGLGPDDARPDKSGLLITPYQTELSSGPLAITIIITDSTRCGTLESGFLAQCIQGFLKLGCNEIRVINFKTKSAIHFLNGEVRNCELIPNKNKDYEGLTLNPHDPPVAYYKTFASPEESQTWLEQNPVPNTWRRMLISEEKGSPS